MKTVIHIVGNRPQFIKLAILYNALAARGIAQNIIHTGQHSSEEMSGIFFKDLLIPEPGITLELDSHNADHFIAESSNLLQNYFTSAGSCLAFVYGDTNTTLAAAIAAKRSGIPLLHFEAGVRTGDERMPEEINRVLTDRLANVNYCCTALNYQTMLEEGYGKVIDSRVLLTGDLMYDAFKKISPANPGTLPENNYVACTIHRAGNILHQRYLSAIVAALNAIHQNIPVVMPVHPHTRKRMAEYDLKPSFTLLNPLGYPAMKTLLMQASFVITDSGGAAREAFFCGKKSVIVMDKPFWPEIIEAACALNCPPETAAIQKAFDQLPSLAANFQSPIFGKGDAAELIAEDIATSIN